MKRILTLLSVVVMVSLAGAENPSSNSVNCEFEGICLGNQKEMSLEGFVYGDRLGNLECELQCVAESYYGGRVFSGQGLIHTKQGVAETLDTVLVVPTRDPNLRLWFGYHVIAEPNGCETLLYSEGFARAGLTTHKGNGLWKVYLDMKGYMQVPIAGPGTGE